MCGEPHCCPPVYSKPCGSGILALLLNFKIFAHLVITLSVCLSGVVINYFLSFIMAID